MFFHRFDRVKNKKGLDIVKQLSPHKITIIFLINPDTVVGKSLLDTNFCAGMGEYSNNLGIDLLYLSSEFSTHYPKFVNALFNTISELSGDFPKDPAIAIFLPQDEKWNIEIIQNVVEDNSTIFRKDVYSLLDALGAKHPSKSLSLWKARKKLDTIVINNIEIIEKIVNFINTWVG